MGPNQPPSPYSGPSQRRSSCGGGGPSKERCSVPSRKQLRPLSTSHECRRTGLTSYSAATATALGDITAAEEEPPLRVHRLRRDAITRRPRQANGNRDLMTSAVMDNLTNLARGYVAPISTAGKVQGLTTWRRGGCERPDLNLASQ